MLRSIRATKQESKNGWDNRKLQAYILERERSAATHVLGKPKNSVPTVENCTTFSAHDWGRRR